MIHYQIVNIKQNHKVTLNASGQKYQHIYSLFRSLTGTGMRQIWSKFIALKTPQKSLFSFAWSHFWKIWKRWNFLPTYHCWQPNAINELIIQTFQKILFVCSKWFKILQNLPAFHNFSFKYRNYHSCLRDSRVYLL